MSSEPYVVEGEWLDREWMEGARKHKSVRSEAEGLMHAAGPRTHPWGPLAVRDEQKTGQVFVFPSQGALDAWRGDQKAATVEAMAHAEDHPTSDAPVSAEDHLATE